MKKLLYLLLGIWLGMPLSMAQITVTHTSSPSVIYPCDSSGFTVHVQLNPAPSASDSVEFTITIPTDAYFGTSFTTSQGIIWVRSITGNVAHVTVNGLTSGQTNFDIDYWVRPDCEFFVANPPAFSNMVSAVYQTQTDNDSVVYNISSPLLMYSVLHSPAGASPFTSFTRRFVFVNQSNLPFTGDIHWVDTLFFHLSAAQTMFNNAQIIYPTSSSIIQQSVTDSSVSIHAFINALPGQDSIVIEETLTILSCSITAANTQTYGRLFYGCSGGSASSLCAVTPNTFIQASITPQVLQPALAMDMLTPAETMGTLLFSCPANPDLRIIRIINQPTAAATDSLQFFLMKSMSWPGEISYFDTSEVHAFYYVGNVRQYIPIISVSNYNYGPWVHSYDLPTPATRDVYRFKIDHTLNPGDSVFIEYNDRLFCVGSPGFPRVYNQSTVISSIRLFAAPRLTCSNSWPTTFNDLEHGTQRGVWGITSQKFEQPQFFQNFFPYLTNLEEEWYDVVNISPLQMNLNHYYFLDEIAVDPANSQIVCELLLDTGVVLVTDSLYLLSPAGRIYPVSIIDNATSGDGGLISAVFDLPSNFFTSNNTGAHWLWGALWKKTNAYQQFFNASSVHFRLRALCSHMPVDSRSEIKERFLFVHDKNCGSGCEYPLSEQESVINLLCPGCLIPGWNISSMKIERENFGYQDVDNNNRPDQYPMLDANATTSEEKRVTAGDTIVVNLRSFVSDGPNISFSNIGFPFKYGWLQFTGFMIPHLQFIDGTGTWRGFSLQFPSSTATVSNDSLFVDLSPAALQPYTMSTLDSMYQAGDTMNLTLRFVIQNNLIFNGNYITNQQINCLQLMSGIPRTSSSMIGYAGPDETIIDPLPANIRKNFYYWCTGNGGSLLAFGNDYSIRGYGSQYGVYHRDHINQYDQCYKQMQVGIAHKMGQIHSPSAPLDVTNQFALNAFHYEIRDFLQIDSVSFVYPSQYYLVDSIFIYQHNLRSDSLTSTTNFENYCLQCNVTNYYAYPTSLARFSGDTVVIYPKMYSHFMPTSWHEFYVIDSLSRGDESKVIVPTLFLKMNDYCTTPDLVDISSNPVRAWLSNMPVPGGNIVLQDSMNVEGYFEDDLVKMSPEFTYSASPQPLITQSNPVSWNFTMMVNAQQASGNLSNHEAWIKSGSPNNFIGAYSPSGNITVTSIVPVTIPYGNSLVYAPISITPLPLAYKIGYLDPSSNTLSFQVNATFNCANINGLDSVYIITGYNCYEYPTSLTNVCGLDTTVLYLQPEEPGVTANFSVSDTASACDTLDATLNIFINGGGNIPHAAVTITLPPSVDYITGSGEISFTDNNNTPVNITGFDPVSGVFDLQSIPQLSSGISQINSAIQIKWQMTTDCNYQMDSIIVQMDAVTYCQQNIALVLHDQPSVWEPSPLAVRDSLVASGMVCYNGVLKYDISFLNPTQNANSVFLQLPSPFVFNANGYDTLSIIYPPGSSGTLNEAYTFSNPSGIYPCGGNVEIHLGVWVTEVLACNINDDPCLFEHVFSHELTCQYSYPLPVAIILADTVCNNGCYTLTGAGTGGQPPYQYNWWHVPTSSVLSTTSTAQACPLNAGEDIILTITDVYGCSDSTLITTSPCCTGPVITCYDTIIPFNQELCNIAFAPDPPSVASDCALASLTNDWPGGYFPWGTTTVTWIAVDTYGNSDTCQQLVSYDPTQMLMSYTILAGKRTKLDNINSVVSGAVGGYNTGSGASFGTNTSVNGPGHFVMAPTIVASTPSLVPIQINTVVNSGILPPFISNTFTGSNITLSGTVSLSAGNYGIITVNSGANVTITGSPVTAYRWMAGSNTTVQFNQPTDMLITEWMHTGNNTQFNPSLENVNVYVGGYSSGITATPVIKVGPLSVINSFMYAPQGRLHAETGNTSQNTQMNGQFIAMFVTSEKYVDWNADTDCSMYPQMLPANAEDIAAPHDALSVETTTKEVLLVPNPAQTHVDVLYTPEEDGMVTIEVYDGEGKQMPVHITSTAVAGKTNRYAIEVAEWAGGVYYVVLQTPQTILTKKLVVVR